MINERKKIDYLTRVISECGGIPAIFVGLVILIIQIVDFSAYLGFFNESVHLKLWFGTIILAIIVALLSYRKVTGYFQTSYGQIQKKVIGRSKKLAYFITFLTYIFGVSVSSRVDAHFNLPFSLTFLLMSCFVAGIWSIQYRGISNVLLYMAIGFLLLSFAPWKLFYSLFNLVEGRNTANDFYSLIAGTIYALTFIVAGSLDYYLLTTNLKPVERRETEEMYESV